IVMDDDQGDGHGRSSLEGAEQVEDAEPPDHPRGFPDDPPRHLGFPRATVDEENRNLADAESLSPRFEIDLDLKAVAVRSDVAQVERFEHLSAEALESAGRVLDGHARDDAAVHVREVGEDQSL